MMWLWQFPMWEVVVECRCSSYSRMRTQIFGSYAQREGPWYSLQNGNDIWKTKWRSWSASFQLILLLRGANLSYQIYGRRACCARTAARVRDDILRSQRTNFHFEHPASLSFQYWGCDMIFEICALFPPQKGSNVRTMFAPIVFFPRSFYIKYNF